MAKTPTQRVTEVLGLLTRPSPPEGAFIAGPWGWGLSPSDAGVLIKKYKKLFEIPGLTTHEIAHSMVEWSEQKKQLRAAKKSRASRRGGNVRRPKPKRRSSRSGGRRR